MKREMGTESDAVNAPAPASNGGHMFERTTRQIKVSVRPAFLADQSAPDNNHFFWAYTVLIENGGADTVQLRARYWRIIDANGRTIEVKGAGVVGQQPILRPGETLRVQVRHAARDAVRHDAGRLSDANRRGRGLPGRHPASSRSTARTKRGRCTNAYSRPCGRLSWCCTRPASRPTSRKLFSAALSEIIALRRFDLPAVPCVNALGT